VDCYKACGGIVGSYSDKDRNCDTECENWCNDIVILGVTDKRGCVESCKSSCKIKESINNIKAIILYIALILAGIMFLVFAYKFITSANPEDRNEAKKGLLYVILALLIIGIADPLINVMLPKPKPESDRVLVLTTSDDTKGEVFPLDPGFEDPKLSDNLVGDDPGKVCYVCVDQDYCRNVRVCLYKDENFEGGIVFEASGTCEEEPYICPWDGFGGDKPSSIKIIDANERC